MRAIRTPGIASALAACVWVTFVAASARPPGVTLRYVYRPGQALLYSFKDDVSSALRMDGAAETQEFNQHAAGTIRKNVVSFSGGSGVVDEVPVKGVMDRTDRRGTTSQAISSQVRRYTFTTRGQLIKTERVQPDGQANTAPQPLDGFSFTLPEKPIAPGATWTDSLQVVGLDGKPVAVKAASTYRGAQQRAGRVADQIDVTFRGTFRLTSPAGVQAPGTLAGVVTYFLARDLGQEIESTSSLTITTGTTVAVDGKPRDAKRILRLRQVRTLAR